MELDRYLTIENAAQGPTRVEPFFLSPEKAPMPQGSDAKNQRWAHTRSLSFRIQVLRQKIHQLERASAIDHLVDQITFAAR